MSCEYGNLYVSTADCEWLEDRSSIGTRVLNIAAFSGSPAVVAVTEGQPLLPGSTDADSSGALKWLSGPHTRPDDPEAVQDVATQLRATQMCVGAGHSAFVTRDGSVFTWGTGSEGQLGLGKLASDSEPQLVEALQHTVVRHVSVGRAHTVALAEDGSLYAWGRNAEGQTGHGLTNKKAAARARDNGLKLVPRFVSTFLRTPISRVSCGHSFTAAVSATGQLWTWGEGGCGQLGIGKKVTKADHPQLVADAGPNDGAPFIDVACGWAHGIALTKRRRVYCWGFNAKGQLGVGDLRSRSGLTQVADPDAVPTPTPRSEVEDEGKGDDSVDVDIEASEADVKALDSEAKMEDGLDAGAGAGVEAEAEAEHLGDADAGEDPFLDTLESKPDFNLTAASIESRAMTLEQSVMDILSVDEVPPNVKLEPDPPVPFWDVPQRELLASQIAAGAYHCAVITPEGQLWTWGASDDGRLGLSGGRVKELLTDGENEWYTFVPVVSPARVENRMFSSRLLSSVACSEKATIVFAPAVVEDLSAENGFDSGGSKLSLYGPGLASLTRIARVGPAGAEDSKVPESVDDLEMEPVAAEDDMNIIEEELGPGHVRIPNVLVRFSQVLSSSPRPADEDAPQQVVCFSHAYCVLPPEGADADEPYADVISCLTPAFGVAADASVELVVGVSAADRTVVRGSVKYTFFASPTLNQVSPQLLPMASTSSGPVVTVGGDGLFGTMMADKQARSQAEQLVAQVEAILARREQAELKAIAALRASGPTEPQSDEESEEESEEEEEEEEEGAGEEGKGGEEDEKEEEEEGEEEPPPPLGITLTTEGGSADAPHEVLCRFSILVDGKIRSTSDTVPGWYVARYEEEEPEPIPEMDDDDDDDDLDSDDDTEEEAELMMASMQAQPRGVFSATVQCHIPALELPEGVTMPGAPADGSAADPAPVINIRVEMSPNGTDFLRCSDLIHSWSSVFSSVSPGLVPVTGGSVLEITGSGFIDSVDSTVKLSVALPDRPDPVEYVLPAEYVDSCRLSVLLPRLEAPPVAAPPPTSGGDGDGEDAGAGEGDEDGAGADDAAADEDAEAPDAAANVADAAEGDDAAGSTTDGQASVDASVATDQMSSVLVEGSALSEVPVLPTLPPGLHTVSVSVALTGEMYEGDMSFSAFAGTLAGLSPMCVTLDGGVQGRLVPDDATAAAEAWFLDTPDTHVRVFNDTFDVKIPCSYDTESRTVVFDVPALKASGDGQDGQDGDAAGAEGAAEGEEAKEDGDAVVQEGKAEATEGDGDGEGDGEAKGEGEAGDAKPELDKEATVALSLDGVHYLETAKPLVLTYYDLSLLQVTATAPAKVSLGGQLTASVEGWESMDPSSVVVRVTRPSADLEYTTTEGIVNDEQTAIEFKLPTKDDGWSPGDGFVDISIDGGTNFSAEPFKFTMKK